MRFDETGHLYITGCLKEIIVLSSGEKVAPADMGPPSFMDAQFEQVMAIGVGKS